jgi:hypothetical protein
LCTILATFRTIMKIGEKTSEKLIFKSRPYSRYDWLVKSFKLAEFRSVSSGIWKLEVLA